MSLSSRSSPTSLLLRTSRLFSLPRPLPTPALEIPSSTGQYRASDTATLPHPTHQAIATPASSHHRGDWGLKRPLPNKVVKRSDAVIKVLGVDTPDHITEFESAAGEVRSVRKFGELGVNFVAKNEGPGSAEGKRSVFEDDIDVTDPDVARTRNRADRRWKNQGPWIAGMSEGEFQKWVSKAIAGRKAEWDEFLTKHFAEKEFERLQREAREAGKWFGPLESASPVVRAGLVVEEAEREARRMVVEAPVEEAEEARVKGEGLVARAKEEKELFEAEARRWTAPAEAERTMKEARGLAFAETRKIFDQMIEVAKRRQTEVNESGSDEEVSAVESAVASLQQARAAYVLEARRMQAPDVALRTIREARSQALAANPEDVDVVRILHATVDKALSRAQDTMDRSLTEAARNAARALEGTAAEKATPSGIAATVASATTSLQTEQSRRATIQRDWESSLLTSLQPQPFSLPDILKSLRASHAKDVLSSSLTALITQFLDLPALHKTDSPLQNGTSGSAGTRFLSTLSTDFNLNVGATDTAPPTTHPAAGLSYLRTNAIMENHPVHGPQAARSPISARVLAARNSAKSKNQYALLGVAGFVASDPKGGEFKKSNPGGIETHFDPAATLDEATPGGGKIWIHPTSASVDEAGRIKLNIVRAEREAVAVKTETTEEIVAERTAPIRFGAGGSGPGSSLLPPERAVGGGIGEGWFGDKARDVVPKANYGSALPDFKRLEADRQLARKGLGIGGARGGGRVRGFEGMDEGDETLRRIEEIARSRKR
ncbi:hypothetical protein B0A48_12073 [Cryoendolithus antarcticus]|uniref:Uncharacterized protein n=1 Tax=Cryoendolithus antarcticus TaxID=1507870 RepID=A0A1V8STS3_9PEZI|nr:hypothetical protein B0A48_12073 [Cryoendolithus antarcticus]